LSFFGTFLITLTPLKIRPRQKNRKTTTKGKTKTKTSLKEKPKEKNCIRIYDHIVKIIGVGKL
jgi:hypothetical protein